MSLADIDTGEKEVTKSWIILAVDEFPDDAVFIPDHWGMLIVVEPKHRLEIGRIDLNKRKTYHKGGDY